MEGDDLGHRDSIALKTVLLKPLNSLSKTSTFVDKHWIPKAKQLLVVKHIEFHKQNTYFWWKSLISATKTLLFMQICEFLQQNSYVWWNNIEFRKQNTYFWWKPSNSLKLPIWGWFGVNLGSILGTLNKIPHPEEERKWKKQSFQ